VDDLAFWALIAIISLAYGLALAILGTRTP
jgi:hypothetical protein